MNYVNSEQAGMYRARDVPANWLGPSETGSEGGTHLCFQRSLEKTLGRRMQRCGAHCREGNMWHLSSLLVSLGDQT